MLSRPMGYNFRKKAPKGLKRRMREDYENAREVVKRMGVTG
jgi:hypothetical protein